MNLFPRAATSVTEIRQHLAYIYYSTSDARLTADEYGQLVLMRHVAGIVEANPERYINGLTLDAFISDFPNVQVAMRALELLKKMNVYRVADVLGVTVLVPCRKARTAKRVITCVSLRPDVIEGLKRTAKERGISVSALITQLWSDNQCKTVSS